MIIDAAREAGVHIHKDEDLVGLLSLLELNDAIPESLYAVVAEVLAYSYWLKGMKPGDEKKPD
jgi:flagellar biosynthesis protein